MLMFEDYMKKELERLSGVPQPPKLLTQVQTIKIRNLEDELLGREFDSLTLFQQMYEEQRKKPLKSNIEKEKVLSYHEQKQQNESPSRGEFQQNQQSQKKKINVNDDSQETEVNLQKENQNSNQNEKEKQKLPNQKIEVKQEQQQNITERTRNNTQSPQMSSYVFKSISRKRRDYQSNRPKMGIPSLGRKEPAIVVSKLEVDRSKYFVNLSPCESTLLPSLVKSRNQSNIRNNHYSNLLSHNNSKLDTLQLLDFHNQPIGETIQIDNQSEGGKSLDSQILHPNSSKIELKPKAVLNIKQIIKDQRKQSLTPNRNQSILENSQAHGVLNFSKILPRKELFENMARANDERFNYIDLPQIYSKTRKIKGYQLFSKISPRTDLFKLPRHIPSYEPRYNGNNNNNNDNKKSKLMKLNKDSLREKLFFDLI